MSDEFKPCPFCGSKIVGALQESTRQGDILDSINCGVCGACGPVNFEPHEFRDQWNARAEHPADDDEPVTEVWLESVGFALLCLSASLILDNKTGGACVELNLTPEPEPSTNWLASFLQGVPDDLRRPDDHVVLTSKYFNTRGDVRRLCKTLGIELTETPPAHQST